jgi:hypothetical protein
MAAAVTITDAGGWSSLSLLDGPFQSLVGSSGLRTMNSQPSSFCCYSSKGFSASKIARDNIGNLSFCG